MFSSSVHHWLSSLRTHCLWSRAIKTVVMAVPTSSKLLQTCVVSATGKHSASVIFLHGSGDTGQGVRAWVKDVLMPDLDFPHIRVVYPTAPASPYTPMRGALSNVWFDRYRISQDSPENLESIDIMATSLGMVIQEEIRAGIPKNKIIIGGFSMGGAMALHLACRYQPDVAGVFALSSFLNKGSAVYRAVEKRAAAGSPLPELFQCHGTRDELVSHKWGEDTMALLKKAGMTASFHSFSGLQHQLSGPEMELLRSWILTKLPPNSCDTSAP